MSYNLFLDDERFPDQVTWVNLPKLEWKIARSFDEFKKILEDRGMPDFISFDHDLGEGVTGYGCVQYIIEENLKGRLDIPGSFSFMVHSMNPIGKANIEKLLTPFLEYIRK